MANQKLTREELEKIYEVQQNNQKLIQELGQIKLTELNLERREEAAIKFLEDTRTQETEFMKTLEDKYGQGSIDIEQGIFIPAEEEDTQKDA